MQPIALYTLLVLLLACTQLHARIPAPAAAHVSTKRSPIDVVKGFAAEFAQTVSDSRDHLKAGAAARGISIFLLYPLDTIKTRLQCSPAVRATMPPLLLKNVFRGVFGSLAGQIPYGMLTFGSYEVYKGKLLAAFPKQRPEALYVLAAIMGDLTGSFWCVVSTKCNVFVTADRQSVHNLTLTLSIPFTANHYQNIPLPHPQHSSYLPTPTGFAPARW